MPAKVGSAGLKPLTVSASAIPHLFGSGGNDRRVDPGQMVAGSVDNLSNNFGFLHNFPGLQSEKKLPPGLSAVPSTTYYDRLGFFCKKEIQFQRVTYLPLKFRLGSYDYVNYLEGKK